MLASFRTTLLAASLVSFAALSAGADDDSLRPVLEARYAAIKSATVAHNVAALSSLLAPDFQIVGPSGSTENAQQMEKELSAAPAGAGKGGNTTLLSIKSDADTAEVEQRYALKNSVIGADGKKQETEIITVSDDSWANVKGVWLLKKTVTKQMDYLVNGRSVTHKDNATAH